MKTSENRIPPARKPKPMGAVTAGLGYILIIATCLLLQSGCVSQARHERLLEEQELRLEGEKSQAVSSAVAQTRATLTANHREELLRLNEQHDAELASIAKENEAATEALKKSHETKIADLTQQHEQQLATELEKTRVQAIKDSETKQWLAANVANIGEHQALTWAVVSLGIAALYFSFNRRLGLLVSEISQRKSEIVRPRPDEDFGAAEMGEGKL
ncbi:hypothetical protein [Rubripirellula reticaptiva]|uniref:Uncharacterized protein n=1 Tax=Rubripirellula reticaptiva TaxID=2528013 RepID=A0A5C6EQ38_9BACT|nr:hypothetical protein [Rubripirellula reticaptiva]TWU49499.1 hypothetical protein Poly59_41140 [Rubripirellula reticaptiva]